MVISKTILFIHKQRVKKLLHCVKKQLRTRLVGKHKKEHHGAIPKCSKLLLLSIISLHSLSDSPLDKPVDALALGLCVRLDRVLVSFRYCKVNPIICLGVVFVTAGGAGASSHRYHLQHYYIFFGCIVQVCSLHKIVTCTLCNIPSCNCCASMLI